MLTSGWVRGVCGSSKTKRGAVLTLSRGLSDLITLLFPLMRGWPAISPTQLSALAQPLWQTPLGLRLCLTSAAHHVPEPTTTSQWSLWVKVGACKNERRRQILKGCQANSCKSLAQPSRPVSWMGFQEGTHLPPPLLIISSPHPPNTLWSSGRAIL